MSTLWPKDKEEKELTRTVYYYNSVTKDIFSGGPQWIKKYPEYIPLVPLSDLNWTIDQLTTIRQELEKTKKELPAYKAKLRSLFGSVVKLFGLELTSDDLNKHFPMFDLFTENQVQPLFKKD